MGFPLSGPVTVGRAAGRRVPGTTGWPVIPQCACWPPVRWRSGADRAGEVGVPVEELPGAAGAPVEVGDPQGHVAPRAAVDADVAAFQARGVGQIPAGGDGEVLQAHGAWMPVSCARVLRN